MRRRKVPTVAEVIDAYLAEQELRCRAGAIVEVSLIRARKCPVSALRAHGRHPLQRVPALYPARLLCPRARSRPR